MFAILRGSAYPVVPWKNGGGTTREIAVELDGGWRLTLATIECDGPFSDFAGYDRTILPLDGNGIVLTFENGKTVTLDRAHRSFAFMGEWKTRCRLLDGPVRDLNIMTRRAQWRHSIDVRRVSETLKTGEDDGPQFSYVIDGAVDVTTPDLRRPQRARAGDTIRVDGPVEMRANGGEASLALIRLDAAVQSRQGPRGASRTL
ncbi:MAG TPA: HutD family protein [Candidatus Baltobacteraceae bacterium]|jgi:hypothetical protein